MKTVLDKKIYANNVPLKNHTTFHIGGPARYWTEPTNTDELRDILIGSLKDGIPYRIIGKGSNILVSDKGFPGLVISLKNFKKISANKNIITVGSGVSIGEFVMYTCKNRLSGAEFLAGIPGSIGGAIKTNAGAEGREVSGILESIETMDKNGVISRLLRKDLSFGYRCSSIEMGMVITGADFKLNRDISDDIGNKVQKNIEKRKNKYDTGAFCAGSIFKNLPSMKAGKIIDELGFKGFQCGGAAVSGMHANIIVNTGKATAEDVKRLIDIIKEKVFARNKLRLELEIEYWQ